MSRTALVCDSSAELPPDLVQKYGINVIPIHVIINGVEVKSIDSEEFESALTSGVAVTTSRPTPDIFLQLFNQLAQRGFSGIVVGALSSSLSGTYESALMAAKQSPVATRVVDSRSVSLGLGFAVLDAARSACGGADLDTVAQRLEQSALRADVFFYVDSLDYLKRGGRVNPALAMVGTALSVKPILHLENGTVTSFAKVRTTAKALDRMVEIALESAARLDSTRFGVQHLGALNRAEQVAARIKAAVPDADITLAQVSPVIGCHAGPGLVGIVVSPDPSNPQA